MFEELYLKVIVFGGRDLRDYGLVKSSLIKLYGQTPLLIVSGGQVTKPLLNGKPNPDEDTWYGADWYAKKFAMEMGYPYEEYAAKWGEFGKSAGPIRNTEMSNCGAKEAVGFWNRQSRGTADMFKKVRAKKMTTHEINYNP